MQLIPNELTVTQDDINTAQARLEITQDNYTRNCPVALAAQRTFNNPRIAAAVNLLYFYDDPNDPESPTLILRSNHDLELAIKRFDTTKEFTPATFPLQPN